MLKVTYGLSLSGGALWARGWIVSSLSLAALAAQTISTGPAVGQPIPELSARDQFGRTQTLKTIAGPKGAMLVFFRSADW